MDPFNTETVFSKKKLFFNIRDSFMSRVVDWKKKKTVFTLTLTEMSYGLSKEVSLPLSNKPFAESQRLSVNKRLLILTPRSR